MKKYSKPTFMIERFDVKEDILFVSANPLYDPFAEDIDWENASASKDPYAEDAWDSTVS